MWSARGWTRQRKMYQLKMKFGERSGRRVHEKKQKTGQKEWEKMRRRAD